MERLARSGDCRSQPLRGADAAASEIRECLRPGQESGVRSLFRDLSNDNRWGRSMSNTKKFTHAFFLSLLIGIPIKSALAQQNVLPETVISATALPTPSEQVASSVTVITEEQIQRDQRRTLPDLLATVPGLNVIQTGGPGGQTSLFMRGTNADHVKVLIDGIEVNDPSQPKRQFDFGPLTTDDIERVEILRGPQSGLYGADAIGGVINIITKSGQGPAQWQASAEGGSFETFNQTAGVRGSTEQFHYSANVEHFHSGATPVTPLELLPPGEHRNDDYYDNLTASTKLGYDIAGNFDV